MRTTSYERGQAIDATFHTRGWFDETESREFLGLGGQARVR